MLRFVLVAVPFAWNALALAADLLVPGQFPTIQAAVNAATDGDRILIAPGTYAERIAWTGKGLSLIGTDGAGSTIIDARGVPGTGPAIDVDLVSGQIFLAQGLTVRGDEARFASGITYFGGAGMLLARGEHIIQGCVIEDCSITNWPGFGLRFGGGVLVYGISTVRVFDSVFRNNSGDTGGAFAAEGAGEIRGCLFENNTALSEGGAALLPPDLIALEDCTFRNNTAPLSGAVRVGSNAAAITRCVFIGNSATDGNGQGGIGGAIRGSISSVFQCVFAGNTASTLGGAVGSFASSIDIESSLFLDNNAPTGSAVSVSQDATASNTIFWGNTGGGIIAASSATVEYCVVQESTPGTGNIIADPMIADPSNEDWSLSPGSPAIDAGSNLLIRLDTEDLDEDGLINDRYPFDLFGNPRFTQDLAVADTGATEMLLPPVDIGPLERTIPTVGDGNEDCNGNFINDFIDIRDGTETDCNDNFVPDSCEIAADPSLDTNGDGIIDACQNLCPADIAPPFGVLNFFDVVEYINRYNAGCP
jgi:hypothetical protein